MASLPNFGIVHENEYLFQKVKKIAFFAFIEVSLFHTMMDRGKKNCQICLTDTRLNTRPRALLQCAFDLMNLLETLSRAALLHKSPQFIV